MPTRKERELMLEATIKDLVEKVNLLTLAENPSAIAALQFELKQLNKEYKELEKMYLDVSANLEVMREKGAEKLKNEG